MFGKKSSNKPAVTSPESTDKSLVAVPAKGSIQAIAANSGSTALALLKAKLILLCDRSGSMDTSDGMLGKKRYEVEDRVVADLQAKYPGQIVVVAFADSAILCLNGELPYPDGNSTVISNALELAAKMMRGDMRAILLTDGEPTGDSEDRIFQAARSLSGRLDIVYIGSDHGPGRSFLQQLAVVTSGTFQKNKLDDPKLLENTIETLLLKSGKKS